ncbi:MAG: DNA mismatch repair protein MutL, partial [Planctomycetes bacterium]|nr:DNA mismatch repair protein MutL [Planctomycetota bacterium]
DQHAAHERVLYEQLRSRHLARAARTQRLLVPEVVDLAAEDKEWLLEAADTLAAEGLLIEDFGAHAVAVHGVPAALGRIAPRALLETMLGGDAHAGMADRPPASATAVLVERFHSMACRAAVMSGDRLDEQEIRALLAAAQELEHPHNCPHGRPTVLNFDRAELERYFRRRV